MSTSLPDPLTSPPAAEPPSLMLWHGSNHPAPVAVPLHAGRLTMLYAAGALRALRLGEVEIVRMIYASVRDENWLTVPVITVSERIEQATNAFEIDYQCRYERGDIRFEAYYHLRGTPDERILFTMRGVAHSAFRKNRIGFCVLHSLRECCGQPCVIGHPHGRVTHSKFPHLVEPHQPFLNIHTLTWRPAESIEAHLEFAGDVFETEDQRNWTDASFKTYCTPLAHPFPVEVQPGQVFEQRVSLSVLLEPVLRSTPMLRQQEDAITFAPLRDSVPCLLPSIGVGCATGVTAHNLEDFYDPIAVGVLRALGLSHLRAEVRLFEAHWQEDYMAACAQATLLNLPLELVLFFGEQPMSEAETFLHLWRQQPTPIKSVLLLHHAAKVTPPELWQQVTPTLRAALPGTLLGIGTDAFFAELNRQRPSANDADFICFSVNPQVHAEDDRTLVENLAAQTDVVATARSFGVNRRVHVAPVTLKRRNNPDATGDQPTFGTDDLPWNVDPRQMSLLGGGWLLGSLKYLTEAKADSLTFFETMGLCGLIQGHQPSSWPKQFAAEPGMVFPIYFVLREIVGQQAKPALHIMPSHSSDPLRVDGLMLCHHHSRHTPQKVLLANYTPLPQQVRVIEIATEASAPMRWRSLDEATLRRCLYHPSSFAGGETVQPASDGAVVVTLSPYAIGVLEMSNSGRQGATGDNR